MITRSWIRRLFDRKPRTIRKTVRKEPARCSSIVPQTTTLSEETCHDDSSLDSPPVRP